MLLGVSGRKRSPDFRIGVKSGEGVLVMEFPEAEYIQNTDASLFKFGIARTLSKLLLCTAISIVPGGISVLTHKKRLYKRFVYSRPAAELINSN